MKRDVVVRGCVGKLARAGGCFMDGWLSIKCFDLEDGAVRDLDPGHRTRDVLSADVMRGVTRLDLKKHNDIEQLVYKLPPPLTTCSVEVEMSNGTTICRRTLTERVHDTAPPCA